MLENDQKVSVIRWSDNRERFWGYCREFALIHGFEYDREKQKFLERIIARKNEAAGNKRGLLSDHDREKRLMAYVDLSRR